MNSPLRYPGGKQRVAKKLVDLFPVTAEFREPFVGGGSIFLEVRRHPGVNIWINDLNPEVYWFWEAVKYRMDALINEVVWLKNMFPGEGKALFDHLKTQSVRNLLPAERAARFFVLNRITFSGTIESGGYSQKAFESRFTDSSIARLEKLEGLLGNVTISNCDYSEVISAPGNAFIFCDPPYCANSKSKLYGRNGDLHDGFDHDRFANAMLNCQHPWLITYDDCERVRTLFESADIQEFSLQYGMNNVGRSNAPKGNELIIRSKQCLSN